MLAAHSPKLVGASRLQFFDAARSTRTLGGLGLSTDESAAVERLERKYGALSFDSGFERNLTVTAGKDLILDRLFGFGSPPGAVNSVGVGTDSTAAAAGQTKLNPTVTGSVFLQAADGGASRTAEVASIQATIATGNGNFAIAEGGLFNGTTNGTSLMLCRIVYGSPFTKSSSVTLVASWTYTQN